MASREFKTELYSGEDEVERMFQTGGFSFAFFPKETQVIAGPKSGHPYWTTEKNCGINSSLNNNTSTQHSYLSSQSGGSQLTYEYPSSGRVSYGLSNINTEAGALANPPPITRQVQSSCGNLVQSGGKSYKVCNNMTLIKSFENVKLFWKSICPGAITLYNKYLAKRDNKELLPIIKELTKAFCHEVKALSSKNLLVIKKQHSKLLDCLKSVNKKLEKMNISSKRLMSKIISLHSSRVMNHYNKMLKTQKNTKKNISKKSRKQNNSRKMRKNNKSKKHRLTKKNRKTRKMKGGASLLNSVAQMNNTPLTLGYSLGGSPGKGGIFANPPPKNVYNNCVDNYNHFTGN